MTAVLIESTPAHDTADPALVRRHIRDLMAAGTSWRAVADLAEVPRSQVHRILYRNPTTIETDVANRILAVEARPSRPLHAADAKTDATGTRRRIQALHHDGYDADHIASAIGETPQKIRTWLCCARIDARHAQAVTDLFTSWSGIPAEGNGIDPETARRARALARKRRWAQAGAWCDDIDDPGAAPMRWYGVRRSEDLVADAEEIRETSNVGWNLAAERLGVSRNTLDKARERVAKRARDRQALAA